MFLTPIDSTNQTEAMIEAGHNFVVDKIRLRTHSMDEEFNGIDAPAHVGIVRMDTKQYLGTVGKGWEPVQPHVLYDLANELKDSMDGKIEASFNMMDGAVIGINLNLGEREYVEGDKVKLSFLMLTSFNGMYGIAGHATMSRQESSINTSSKVYNLRHTKYVANRLTVVKEILKYYEREIENFDKKMQGLVNKRMSTKDALEWFRSLFPEPKSTVAEKKLDNQVILFLDCLENGTRANVRGVKGTSYGAYMALAEYINHHRSVRVHNGRDEDEVRFQSIHFGTGNNLAQRGLNKLAKDIVVEFTEDEFLLD
jgi:phage/plasmid-like protein (TIGR03299 family)